MKKSLSVMKKNRIRPSMMTLMKIMMLLHMETRTHSLLEKIHLLLLIPLVPTLRMENHQVRRLFLPLLLVLTFYPISIVLIHPCPLILLPLNKMAMMMAVKLLLLPAILALPLLQVRISTMPSMDIPHPPL